MFLQINIIHTLRSRVSPRSLRWVMGSSYQKIPPRLSEQFPNWDFRSSGPDPREVFRRAWSQGKVSPRKLPTVWHRDDWVASLILWMNSLSSWVSSQRSPHCRWSVLPQGSWVTLPQPSCHLQFCGLPRGASSGGNLGRSTFHTAGIGKVSLPCESGDARQSLSWRKTLYHSSRTCNDVFRNASWTPSSQYLWGLIWRWTLFLWSIRAELALNAAPQSAQR